MCVHTWANGTGYTSNGWNEDENVKKFEEDLFEQDVSFGMKQMDLNVQFMGQCKWI